jgi:hypothetical protein
VVNEDQDNRIVVRPEDLDDETKRENERNARIGSDSSTSSEVVKPEQDLAEIESREIGRTDEAGHISRPARPWRPMDEWERTGRPPKVRLDVERKVTYEVDPCPTWMKPETYRALMIEVRDSIEAHARIRQPFIGTRRMKWALRHVVKVTHPPTISSDAGVYDMIGPIFDALAEARRRGIPLEQLAIPTKQRMGKWKRGGHA